MKNFFASAFLAMTFVSLLVSAKEAARKPASTFERESVCNSHSYSNLKFPVGMNLKSVTEACSLGKAADLGKEVCESNNFAWLRPEGGKPMALVNALIYTPVCHDVDGDITCTTRVTVDCQ